MVVARNAVLARHMVVRPNGDLYVALDNAVDGSITGAVLALRDTDGDGRADVQQRFGPTGGNGIALGGTQLFFAPDDRVLRYELTGNSLAPTEPAVTVVSGLPSTGDHHRKTVVLDGAGGMFVNIGSMTNSCQVHNRADFSPGIDPCPELPVRAGVWRFSAHATGQTQANGSRFATELRNMNALAINPADGALYGVQNGRDQLYDNWPTLFTARDDALLPAEELFRIERGKAYGWPYCYYDGIHNKKVLAPEYGGDGRIVGRCASRELPIDEYPAHWAPLSMLFYTGTQFPKQYAGGLFIAYHGSKFDPSQQPAGPGYVVTFVPWGHGKPTGRNQIFADGFAGGNPTPAGSAHRAVGLAEGPDGSLYISDDKAGWIWRVLYVGDRKH
ncbi:MAG: sorbosone dehydrogenase [Gemmatimonadaceae bacterium]